MTEVTLRTIRHNEDGTVTEGTITVDPSAPGNPIRRARPTPPIPGQVFLSRVTDQEYTAVMAAAQAGLQNGQPALARFLDILRMNGEVHPGSAVSVAAKAALVAANLLTQDRADAIFAPI